ncbi:hypothetical protein V6574_01735 [Streptomyces sp. SM1P]
MSEQPTHAETAVTEQNAAAADDDTSLPCSTGPYGPSGSTTTAI